MKVLIVYDSVYGNTEKIARTIAEAFSQSDEVKVLRAVETNPQELESVDLLIVGSPTQAGRPVQTTKEFLGRIPANALGNCKVAAFDTRFTVQGRKLAMRIFLGMLGYAAGCIEKSLLGKGGHPVSPPEGFIVDDTRGPLKEGEVERAAEWAKGIMESVK
ncbi:flavodoxin family protein [Chloroflexota bacterium]